MSDAEPGATGDEAVEIVGKLREVLAGRPAPACIKAIALLLADFGMFAPGGIDKLLPILEEGVRSEARRMAKKASH